MGIHLVIPRRLSQTAISAIQLQSQQSDCNLSNPTAISAIQLQSPQSDCIKFLNLHIHLVIPRRLSQTAISAIQLQSPQSNCNLNNQTAKSSSIYIYTWS